MRRILIVVVIFVLIGGGLVLYRNSKKTNIVEPNGTGTFFPIGENVTPNGIFDGQSSTNGSETSDPIVEPSSPFKQITGRPVAGFTTFTREVTITTPATDPKKKPTKEIVVEHVIRYVSRANGFVYEIKDGGTPLQITNIYIPNIYEATFADNNKTAILRFLRADNNTIATYSVPIPEPNPDGTRTQKEGIYLPDNITSLAIAPNQLMVGRLTNESTAGVITLTNTANASKKEVIRSPFKEWTLLWPNQNSIFVQTKAAGSIDGFLYGIDQNTKRFRRVLGNIAGLTASISPSGTYVLYSQSTQNGFTTKLLNAKTNVTKDLGVSILPEKCTWLKNDSAICAGNDVVPSAMYPDSWYAGIISFSDKLYRINPAISSFETISEDTDGSFDITSIRIDEAQNIVYFINKQTGTLWQFTL